MDISDKALEIIWVASTAELQEWCDYWATLPVIAVDTEFVRRTTYFPIAGLIQVSEGEKSVLIDPLTIDDWSAFRALMVNEQVMKVLHACSEDLDLFEQLLGVLPTPFFDTQIGEAYASAQWSLSYVKLIQEYLGIEVTKDETRSDWVKRPLTEAQKRYAALDVIYLAQVYPKQLARLNAKNMLPWVLEDCQALKEQYRQNTDPEQNWDGVKSAWRLPPRSLTFLRAIFIWRDEQASQENVPKGYILKDRTLWSLAKFLPANHIGVAQAEEITGRQHRLYGEQVLKTIQQVNELSDDELQLPLEMPLPSSAGDLSKAIRAFVQQKAKELDIAPEAVLKRKLLEPILRHLFTGSVLDLDSIVMTGWRKETIIDPILLTFRQD